VLKTCPLRNVDGDREPDGAAEAIAEPDRPDAGVLDRQPLRGFQGGTGGRRPGDIELVEFR
jgi:hypothetical protein